MPTFCESFGAKDGFGVVVLSSDSGCEANTAEAGKTLFGILELEACDSEIEIISVLIFHKSGAIVGIGVIKSFSNSGVEVNTSEIVGIPVWVTDIELCDFKLTATSVLTFCESVIVSFGAVVPLSDSGGEKNTIKSLGLPSEYAIMKHVTLNLQSPPCARSLSR